MCFVVYYGFFKKITTAELQNYELKTVLVHTVHII
jgi:hypothetical protein